LGDESALTIERTQLVGGVEDVGGSPTRLKVDETSGSLRVNLWVWRASTLEWVRMIQPEVAFKPMEDLLEQLINQIKIMNTQLAILTGEEVKEEDV
jgi:hypothetical protein